MRLYLLPLTTGRTLLYCQRIHVSTIEKQGLVDKVTIKAAKVWAGWEKYEKGWQKKIVDYGNYALRRIPYQEWGLKSVPPLSSRRRDEELKGNKVDLIFPPSIISVTSAERLLAKLATERNSLHKKRLTWCFIGMPLTIPFVLIPVIPNFPFFYLAYRAWSHWRAIAGGSHLEFLRQNKLLRLAPSKDLDHIYHPLNPTPGKPLEHPLTDTNPLKSESDLDEGEEVILSHDNGREIAEFLELPELRVEMERAIWQVEQARKRKQKEEASREAPGTTEKPNSTPLKEDKSEKK